MLDLLITGGRLCDGTGAPARSADVGIAGETVDAVGDLAAAEARTVIDAAGRTVCPGFIDVHSHSDAYLVLEPAAPSKITQGITTEVVGNCGASAAPITGEYLPPADWRDYDYPGTWATMAEYRELLARVEPALNVVALVGHRNIRCGVMGYEQRSATPDEVREMVRLLEQALAEGGRGLSTGLIYAPAMFAETSEIHALATVAARAGGFYTSHMRSEMDGLLEAIDEVLEVTRATGIRTEISHLKIGSAALFDRAEEVIGRIRAAIDNGLPVKADRYPYTAGATDLDVVLPDWAHEGGPRELLKRLRDPGRRAEIRAAIIEERSKDAFGGIIVGSTITARHEPYRGRTVAEVAADMGCDTVDAVLALVDENDAKAGAFFPGLKEENMRRILAEPWVMVGCDASLRSPSGPLSRDYPHPRAYGTFPRYLRLVLDGAVPIPMEEAIRKITSLPADHFGLAGRGRLERGRKADVVVFDPETVRDRADYGNPHRFSEGIHHVIVNGALTYSNGRFTGDRAGEVL